MIAWPPRPRGRRALETGFLKVESIDKRINDTNRIVVSNPLLKTIRKKRDLLPIYTLDEARNVCP